MASRLVAVALLLLLPAVECRPIRSTQNASIRPTGLPIIFIPGKGGNQLEAKIDRDHLIDGKNCPKRLDWYRIWIDLWMLFKGGIDCWAQNMELKFNETTGVSSNAAGVRTRVPGWGKIDSVEYVDPSWTAWIMGNLGKYAADLIEGLVYHGYERDVSVRAAPYDFRYAPPSQGEYFKRLRDLIEQTSLENGDRKVLLVAHSMGGIMSNYFLSQQPVEWKDRFIAGLITINTPWAGAVVLAEMQASGINWEIDAIDRLTIRGQQRSYEAGIMLLPHGDVWTSDDVIVSTPSQNFTVLNYDEFFQAIGYPVGRKIQVALEATDVHFDPNRTPGVPVYCTYSLDVPTPEMLIYETDEAFPDSRPRRVMADGDGTISRRSLTKCKEWIGQDKQHPVIVKEYHGGINHQELLSDQQLINYIVDIATI